VNAGYGFTGAGPLLGTAALLAALLLLGRWLERRPVHAALAIARTLPPLAVGAAALATDAEPAGTRMLALAAALFVAMKCLVLAAARAGGEAPLAQSTWWSFVLLWPGMAPGAFAVRPAVRSRPDRAAARRFAVRGLRNLLAGAALVLLARALRAAWLAPLLLVGLSLLVHFGLFTLLAALHRASGRRVRPPFDAPHRTRSLGEFWANRWNRGFAEMTALLVQRPLARRFGRRPALLLSFLASGILHEVAISLPVRAGYGLPTCYFLLQGALVAWLPQQHGRAVALLAVLLPVPLVFHPPFVRGVIVPLLG
jgi:alginate O-acetyltransferase complex protein AlgI